MIDFIKLNITHVPKSKLLNNSNLEWIESVNRTTGEVLPRREARFHNMRFVMQPTSIRMYGSLHILHRTLTKGKPQNYDDFTYQDILEAVQLLMDYFGIDPKRANIENLEYGVNVSTVFKPKRIIQEHLLMWDFRDLNTDLNFNRLGKFKQWSLSQYDIKCYDKGLHYNLNENILRFEKRVRKSAVLLKHDIHKLSDLLETNKLVSLRDDLLLQFDKLLILDSLKPSDRFTSKEKDIFLQGINPSTWYNFKNNTSKMRYKRKLAALIGNFELDQIKQGIRRDISKKYEQLLCNDFTYSKTSNLMKGKSPITAQLTARKQHNNSEE